MKLMMEVVDWKFFLTSSLRISVCSIACKKTGFNQPGFYVTDQHKLVEEVGGEAEGEQSLPSENHVMAPAKRSSAGFVEKSQTRLSS